MRPEDLRTALGDQPVPDHRPGFWDELAEEITSESTVTRRRAGWQVAVSAAAVVIVVVGVAALLVRQNSVEPLDTGPVATNPIVTSQEQTTISTTAPESTSVMSEIAPWDREKLAGADASPVLIEEWQLSENQLWCSGLFPDGFDTGGATIRRAEFAGGWAVAWDLPGLRSAFGIAGTGSPAWVDIGIRMPKTVAYGDQVVGYGGEGFDEAAQQRLAEFAIPGQLCGYQAWSKLGDEHLLELVDSLRRVDGLEAEPVGDDRVDFGPLQRGAAPWAAPSIAYPDDYPAAPTETLAFLPTSGLPDGATVRTTTQPMWSLAWDLQTGPGHDEFNYPCASCGRGVVGITVTTLTTLPDGPPDARWDDGSVGYLLPRVGDPAVPLDRVRFRDPETDELLPGAARIDIYIPDYAVVVSVWSHLGLDSLEELVDGLRLADPGA